MRSSLEEFLKKLEERKNNMDLEADLFRRLNDSKIKIKDVDGSSSKGFEFYTPDYSIINNFEFFEAGHKKMKLIVVLMTLMKQIQSLFYIK